jgi:hypothetical protein
VNHKCQSQLSYTVYVRNILTMREGDLDVMHKDLRLQKSVFVDNLGKNINGYADITFN